MKKKILEALATKFEGVDAKILDRVATKLAKTVTKEEEVEPAVEGVTFQDILTSYGDARATEASKTAVSTYEKKHGLRDGKKVDTDGDDDEPDDDTDDDEPDDDEKGGKPSKTNPKAKKSPKNDDNEPMPKWVRQLLNDNKELKDRLDAIDKGKVAATRKDKLNKAIEKLTDKQKKPYGRVKLDDMSDDEFDAFIEEVTEDAEEMAAENEASGATFGAPIDHKGGDGKKATEKEIDSIADALNI